MKNRYKIILIIIAFCVSFLGGLTVGFAVDEDPSRVVVELPDNVNVTPLPVDEPEEQAIEIKEERVALGTFEITAYCPCSYCCGKSDGITATGTKAKQGRTIAVDPDVIPLGSLVEIDDVQYIAEDVGGAVDGNRIDLYFESHEDALKWGRRKKEVYLIEEAR